MTSARVVAVLFTFSFVVCLPILLAVCCASYLFAYHLADEVAFILSPDPDYGFAILVVVSSERREDVTRTECTVMPRKEDSSRDIVRRIFSRLVCSGQ